MLKITVFCDVTPCNLANMCRHFRGFCYLCSQGRRISFMCKSQSRYRDRVYQGSMLGLYRLPLS